MREELRETSERRRRRSLDLIREAADVLGLGDELVVDWTSPIAGVDGSAGVVRLALASASRRIDLTAPPARAPIGLRGLAVLDACSPERRRGLIALRRLVLGAAAALGDTEIIETAARGCLSYSVSAGGGEALAIGPSRALLDGLAVHFVQGRELEAAFREIYPDAVEINERAILISARGEIPTEALHRCFTLALAAARPA
jgi:hypothetical protein